MTTLQQLLEESELDFEIKKVDFLVYDKSSGSRWLDDNELLSWHKSQLERAYQLGREEGMARYEK